MARKLARRLLVEATLTALTPIQVGGAEEGDLVDIAAARDGLGRLYIPGTGLAGALRAWCQRRFSDDLVNRVWGFQDATEGHASHIVVDDALLDVPGGEPEVWPGVGIDRFTGAAASEVLYSREVLPRGTEIPLALTLEIEEEGDREPVGMLRHLLEGLQAGIYLGGAKTRGSGRVKMAGDPKVSDQNWTTVEGVTGALNGTGREIRIDQLADNPAPNHLDVHEIVVDWRAVDPVMVAAGYDGLAVDILPMVSAVSKNNVALVLPGSAIKGALRSVAERIMRTLLGLDVPEGFLDQVKVPLVNELFGEALTAEGAGRAGAVTVDTCYSKATIKRKTWESITMARTDEDLRKRLDATGLDIDQAYHVKIDRWTGGAFETALYSALEPRVEWEPIRIVFDRERLYQDLREPATVLLALTLGELADGRVPLGFGVNRGYGGVEVKQISGAPWEFPTWWKDLTRLDAAWHGYLAGLRTPVGIKE